MKMTIHRGLAELKLIDSKITKKINSLNPCGGYQNGKKINNHFTQEEFKKEAKSGYDSIKDLINRKIEIKTKIVEANAKTIVEVGGKKMSIADAISHKAIIDQKAALLHHLKVKYSDSIAVINKNNEIVEDNALKIAMASLQKDNVKIGDEDAIRITEPYLKANKWQLADPLDVLTEVKDLENEIDDFNTEIDAVLSEANAVTFIEITD